MTSYLSPTIRAWKDEQLILAFFPPETKLRIGLVREICVYAKDCRASHHHRVHGEITSFTKTHITNYRIDNNVKIETFSLPQLQFTVVEHEMVPPHRLLSEDEKRRCCGGTWSSRTSCLHLRLRPHCQVLWARGQVSRSSVPRPRLLLKTYRIVCKGTYKG